MATINLLPSGNWPSDFNLAVRAGLVPEVSKVSALGHSDSVGSSGLRCLYHGADTADISDNVAALLQTPGTCYLASTSTADTSDGTGARTVLVSGIDSDGDAATAVATLNGQTGVDLGTWAAIRSLQVLTAGNGGVNAGTLWVATSNSFTAGAPNASNHLNAMEVGTNVSATALMVVPLGHTWYVDQFTVYEGDTSKVLNFQFYQYSYSTGLWYEAFDIHGKQGSILADVKSYPGITGLSAVMIRTVVDTGSAIVTGSIGGYLVKD